MCMIICLLNEYNMYDVCIQCRRHQRRSLTSSMKQEICKYKLDHPNASLKEIAAIFNVKWSMPLTNYTIRYIVRASDKWLGQAESQGHGVEVPNQETLPSSNVKDGHQMETNLTDNNIEMKPGENDIILPKSGILHKYWHK